ncbi:transporter substrate-binding domain-containing protein [Anoxybacterium hadale]|uniref:Transporter substrate-binding domain-containing protein n=1 Tax=Anoxybacterium hadale TaxID=3408580 RepID=A0ACD1AAK5_9FIRM|nr:transporter substrate-binding domain-containing protein [Clostridiales bacterium]
MKKAISIILLIFLTAAVCFGLIACGTSGSGSGGEQEDVDVQKVLRVGMECNYAPFDWTQSDDSNGAVPIFGASGQYANGYDVIVAKKLAEELGYELQIHKTEWDGLIPALQTDKIDAIVAGMCMTDERKLSIDFSDVYYSADIVAITMKGNPYENAHSLADLAGAKVTTQMSTNWYDMLPQIAGAEITPALADVTAVVLSVTSGKSDAVVVDMPTAVSAQLSNPDLVILDLSEGDFAVEPGDVDMGIGIKKGNTALLDEVNSFVSKITPEDREAMMAQAAAVQPLSN